MLQATGWSFLGMHLVWWAFWIMLFVTVSATFTPVPKSQMKSGERALDILRRRFAAGELSSQEFERRKAVLERDEPRACLYIPQVNITSHELTALVRHFGRMHQSFTGGRER